MITDAFSFTIIPLIQFKISLYRLYFEYLVTFTPDLKKIYHASI